MFNAVIAAIPEIIPDLIAAIPDIIDAIVEALGEGWEALKQAGKDLIAGLWEGISDSYDWIKTKIEGWVGNVTDFIKKLFGIGSPSKLFRDEIGKWLPEGIAVGFDKDMPSALKDMKKTMNSALSDLKSDVAVQTEGLMGDVKLGKTSGSIGTNQQNVNFYQTINSPKAVDRLTLYRETNSLLFSAKVRLNNV